MPPAALLVAGVAAGAVGSGLSQAAANKGPRALFPGLQQQGVSGVSKLGAQSFNALGGMITNPGALPDVNASVDPAFAALYNANKQFVSQGRANVREQFGATGLSNSSSAAIGVSNFETQSNADFMNILAQYTLQAQELAANRELAAAETGLRAFMGPAFTDIGPKGSVLGAVLGGASGGLETLSLLRALGGLGTSGKGKS